MNRDFDKQGFTFFPRRMASNPFRIDYILTSGELFNKALNNKLETVPDVDINEDHDYFKLDPLFGKNMRTREERRSYPTPPPLPYRPVFFLTILLLSLFGALMVFYIPFVVRLV